MELAEFKKDFIENIKTNAAASGEGTVSTFVNEVLNSFIDQEMIPEFYECYSVAKYSRKNYRIDAYAYDEFDYSLSLFIAEFSGNNEDETINRTECYSLFEKIYTFIDGCINGRLIHDLEISRPIYDLALKLVESKEYVRKYKFYILTDKNLSSNVTTFENSSIQDKIIEYNVWDITRIQRNASTYSLEQDIEIDIKSMICNGLPCLEASDVSDKNIQCYLCVIPGSTLADLYDKYGSKLLEGNIRSFLSTRGAINKNIRKTIISSGGENKKMFFSYNNGISATAKEIEIDENSSGKFISKIKNLQIVNGGQTTASLSNARFKDKADLNGIYVQMKLTVIPDPEQAHIFIPNISKYSNSQNKVSTADLVSNNDFNIRIEQISRRIYAPAVDGYQYETHWFYERTRGQYENEQSKMTPSEKKKYLMQNPKEHKITKTDFAKYINSWNQMPYSVSAGSQKNFIKFAEEIESKWAKDNSEFNEIYFKNTVAIAIMFKFLDKYIPRQEWYSQGYKANIVTYSIAYLRYLIKEQFKDKDLDLSLIWQKQSLPDCLANEFEKISKFVFFHITDENRQIQNVTEWCKKTQCWDLLKKKNYALNEEISSVLISKDELSSEKRRGKQDQKEIKGIEAQSYVINKGSLYWKQIEQWGSNKQLLSQKDVDILKTACYIDTRKIPSDKQCMSIISIEKRLIEEGFSVK